VKLLLFDRWRLFRPPGQLLPTPDFFLEALLGHVHLGSVRLCLDHQELFLPRVDHTLLSELLALLFQPIDVRGIFPETR
jgi:hypothetical protein